MAGKLRYSLITAAVALLTFLVGSYIAEATHDNSLPRPAHLPESTAHTSLVPSGAAAGMQSGYDYWNGAATQRTLNSYQNPVTFGGEKRELVVDYVGEGGQACIYDFSHCLTMLPAYYALYGRYGDLNVGHVVWNRSLYGENYPPVEGLPWNHFVGRHELGHDQRLALH